MGRVGSHPWAFAGGEDNDGPKGGSGAEVGAALKMLEPCCSQARALGSRDSRLDTRRRVRLKCIQSIRLRTLGLSHGCPHARRIRLLDLGDHLLVELWPRLGELLKARRDARLRDGQRSTGKNQT